MDSQLMAFLLFSQESRILLSRDQAKIMKVGSAVII